MSGTGIEVETLAWVIELTKEWPEEQRDAFLADLKEPGGNVYPIRKGPDWEAELRLAKLTLAKLMAARGLEPKGANE